MVNLMKMFALCMLATVFLASPVQAQEATEEPAAAADTDGMSTQLSGAFGAGLVCIGSAFGIGKLAAAAVESMARQPEVAGNIQVAMIIAAALIEGFTFYAIFVCSTQNPWPAVG